MTKATGWMDHIVFLFLPFWAQSGLSCVLRLLLCPIYLCSKDPEHRSMWCRRNSRLTVGGLWRHLPLTECIASRKAFLSFAPAPEAEEA